MALTGCSSGSSESSSPVSEDASGQDITLWLAGSDTPDELRQYLIDTYAETTGGTLTIEEQAWGDLISNLTTALPDSANTPDVVEIGNTQSATFTTAGAFLDISDMVEELGGDDLLQGFLEAGSVGDTTYAVPYYAGSRVVFYRKDIWEAAGLTVPSTLEEFNEDVKTLKSSDQAGLWIGGSDWRNAISWIFANGGELATYDGSTWTSTFSDANTITGLEQFQDLFQNASTASTTDTDAETYLKLNDATDTGTPDAATALAPSWAYWSIGDPVTLEDGTEGVEWNDDKWGVFALPGVDGGVAPVFAGGSNIAISAASTKQAGAKELLKIIFSEEYQTMLAENGLLPGNTSYNSAVPESVYSEAAVTAAENAKLTPAAPGWAALEESGLLEEFFSKVADGGDIEALAAEYDPQFTEYLNQ